MSYLEEVRKDASIALFTQAHKIVVLTCARKKNSLSHLKGFKSFSFQSLSFLQAATDLPRMRPAG